MVFDETEITFLPHDDMVQNSKIDGTGGFHEGKGQLLILRGWLEVSTGVIVDENDTGGMIGQGFFNNTPGIDDCPVYGPFLNDFIIQNLILGVQKDGQKGFMGKTSQFYPGKIEYRLRGREHISIFHLIGKISRANPLYQPDEGCRDGADLGHLFEFLLARIQDTGEGSKAFDQILGIRLDVFPGDRIGKKELQDLIVVHPLYPILPESLP